MVGLFDIQSIWNRNDWDKSSTKSIASITISLYLGGWGIYYLTSESLRYNTINKRSRNHKLKSKSGSTSLTDPTWFGGATSAEATSIKQRFSSFSILGRYQNVTQEWREQGLWELIAYKSIFLWQSKGKVWSDGGFSKDMKSIEGREKIERLLPVFPLDKVKLWGNGYREKSELELKSELKEEEIVGVVEEKVLNNQPAALDEGISYTWIGQSTCLIQLQGLTILTDPVFQLQPIKSIFSPKRLRPMPCGIAEILSGRIDIVLLSHNHFDHLDLTILKSFPKTVKWFVPLGVAKVLKSNGLKKEIEVKEMDWWEEIGLELKIPVRVGCGSESERLEEGRSQEKEERIKMKDLKIQIMALPALHWTGRMTPLDTNTTLWCSYSLKVVEDEPKSLFFSCDTGYSSSLYSSIGRLLGPFDLAIIPIGSYSPRWHMSIQHIDPKGAVSIAKDIGAKRAFATHHGTWIMSEEPWDEPQRLLKEEVEKVREGKNWFISTGFGETIFLQ